MLPQKPLCDSGVFDLIFVLGTITLGENQSATQGVFRAHDGVIRPQIYAHNYV